MEGRDSPSPNATHTHTQQHGGHVSFGSYFPREYALMGSSPSIITPTAKRHNSATTQPFTVISNTNPNLNYNPSSNANSVVHNLNPSTALNPNSGSPVYFGGAEATAPSPPLPSELMSSLAERPSSEPVKKKRGRPRKYTNDANGTPLSIPGSPLPGASGSVQKKKAPKSGKKAQLSALGAAGQNFTPHVLTVGAGEDVSTKIISFTSQGPWAVCILSANGAISNATLRHAGVSGGAMTYEGRFEILSLSGSFLLTENGGTRSRTGGLSVSLAGPDGRVIGGGVAGLLMAASPVQVVVGTFYTGSSKSILSGEANSGIKTSGLAPLRMPASSPMVQPPSTLMEGVDAMQDPLLDASGDGEDPRIFRHVPLRSVDCFGSQFDGDARGDTEPESASPGGP